MVGSLPEALLIVGVGLAVGWGATKSGLGVGLSLPLLAACGLALPAALLAVKLPVAVSDLAAALGERRGRCAPVLPAPMTLCCGAVAGAVAAWGVLHVPAGMVAVVAPLLALVAWRWPRRGGQMLGQAAVWGAYVGGCGLGAGLLWRLAAPGAGSGLALRAAANGGALGVLLLAGSESGRAVTDAVCLLAVAQGTGAWFATHRGQLAPPV